MAEITAVCISQKKGAKKHPVEHVDLVANYGIQGDGHADSQTHRQVSLLAVSSIDKMKKLGLDVKPGDFAENITVEGMDVCHLPLGTRLKLGDEVELEITQIGKECHDRCAIFKQVGTCIMPVEGVFARVVSGGRLKAGNSVLRC